MLVNTSLASAGAVRLGVCLVVLAAAALGAALLGRVYAENDSGGAATSKAKTFDDRIRSHAMEMVLDGRKTFRFDTFADEAFWGGKLQLHQAIKGERLGGVGAGISPKGAVNLGLKVDVDALPAALVSSLQAKQV